MNLLNYYKTHYKEIYNGINNPFWRVWKVFDSDGKVYQNQMSLSSEQKLWDLIGQCKNPVCLYVSTS